MFMDGFSELCHSVFTLGIYTAPGNQPKTSILDLKKLYTMRFRILFSIAFSFLLTPPIQAQDLETTIELGERYFSSGQIPEALYTYQRAVFYSPSGADAGLLLRIAECFEIEGDFDRSIEYFDHAFFSESSDSLRTEILFKKAISFIKTGNYHFALIELLGIESKEGTLTDRRRSLYLASSYFGLDDYSNSESYFLKALPNNTPEAYKKVESIFQKKSNFSRPNPSLAMWLSVFIPGVGQFYAGDWVAGINSFLLTGSLVGLTFYLTGLYHPIDAMLTALPWFQRYYQGGFGQAEKIAGLRRTRNRNVKFQEILDIIMASNSKSL